MKDNQVFLGEILHKYGQTKLGKPYLEFFALNNDLNDIDQL